MNEKEYKDKMAEALKHAEDVKQKQEIAETKHSNDKEKKPLSFSKMAVIFIFINCFIIELYSMVVMAALHDLSSLGSLIASVIGQCVTLVSYMYKAKSENCEGGITYETAMYELKEESESLLIEDTSSYENEDDGAVG